MNVLVIDDSNLFQQILKTTFLKTPIHPILCNDSASGIDALNNNDIDFICVSMFLKDTDGLTLIKKIRKYPQHIHTPIILFTSEESDEIYMKALSSGCTEVFHKKDVSELVNFIQRFTLQQQEMTGQVLYIEDTLSQQKVISEIFSKKGLNVDAFTTAESALKAYTKKDYDIVVTDIILEGGMTGMSLINRIRRLDGVKGEVPILALTAFDDICRRIDLFYLGVSDYVIKPVIEEELLARVRNLIDIQKFHTEAIKQTQLAEQANIAKSVFLANMSHEFRTPMHGILSYANMGIKNISKISEEKKLRFFSNIKLSASRLMLLLNDILDIAKLESGKFEIKFLPNSLKIIVQSCIAEQQAHIDEKHQKLICMPNNIDGLGVFDGNRIGQVITNLLSNAIKFTSENKSIEFTIRTTEMNQNNKLSEAFLFTVKDYGQGIPEAELETIFEQFVQGSEPSINKTKGTGLGLPISKKIIDLHKGRIWAENCQDGGAIFSFIIPCTPPLIEKKD